MTTHTPDKWTELLEAARGWLNQFSDAQERVWEGDRDGMSSRARHLAAAIRAFNPPKPKRHTFGGVTFEETGEVRSPRDGEWFTAVNHIHDISPVACAAHGWHAMHGVDRAILKHVALEGE